jgi:hypothetical protein
LPDESYNFLDVGELDDGHNRAKYFLLHESFGETRLIDDGRRDSPIFNITVAS